MTTSDSSSRQSVESPAPTLLACPFCGETPTISPIRHDESLWSHNIVAWSNVYCSNCDIGFDGCEDPDSAKAIALWNGRSGSPAPTAGGETADSIGKRLDEIEALANAATLGPWSKGRDDMDSFHAGSGEQFANVYADAVIEKVHLGHELPLIVAQAHGADPHANARFIANARQDVPWLVSVLRASLLARQRDGEREALLAERDAMRHTFAWLLGEEGEFPNPPEHLLNVIAAGKNAHGISAPVRLYWWRRDLRERWADAIRVGPDNPNSEVVSAPSAERA